jgi:hypothetical protein
MRMIVLFVIMVCVGMGPNIVMGKEKEKVDQEISLPAEVNGWKWDRKELKYNAKTLFDYMDGSAELYLAYRFLNLTVRRFGKLNRPPIILELYEMASSEDAYGVFSFERQDESIEIGQGSEFGGGLLRFWKGKYFVSLYAEGEGKEVEPAILKMGRDTANSIPVVGLEPKLSGFIPGKDLGLVDKSIRYLKSHILLNQRFFIAHQNILNLNQKTEVVLAQYLRDNQKTHLLLIRYPNVREAEDAYQGFMKIYLPEARGKDHLKTEDRRWTFARQRSEMVLIVFGAPTAAHAEALLKATEEKLTRK